MTLTPTELAECKLLIQVRIKDGRIKVKAPSICPTKRDYQAEHQRRKVRLLAQGLTVDGLPRVRTRRQNINWPPDMTPRERQRIYMNASRHGVTVESLLDRELCGGGK